MRVAIDANILMDVLQHREPFYQESARCLSLAMDGKIKAIIPAHIVPTIYYMVRKQEGQIRAMESVRIVLEDFEVTGCSSELLRQALELKFSDYEDAIVAASARQRECDFIITRNSDDFLNSPVPTLTPSEFLKRHESSIG